MSIRKWYYLRFDLSSLAGTSAADVVSATLYLYLYSKSVSTDSTMTAYHVATDTWGETTITWNDKPAAGDAMVTTGTISGTYERWVSYNLLANDTGWVSTDLSDGFLSLVVQAAGAADFRFRSREYGGTTYDPYLKIEVIPLPPTVLLLGSGLVGLALLGRRKFKRNN